MTDNMKCPICRKDLVEIELGECWFLACDNSKCRCKGVASYVVWQALITSKKAQDALMGIGKILLLDSDKPSVLTVKGKKEIKLIITSITKQEE